MKKHLPECFSNDSESSESCICERLLAAEERERFLWERIARERIEDLMSCHKHDDCHARADSIEVLLDDVKYSRMPKEELHLPECDYVGSGLPEAAVGCICSRLRACEERIEEAMDRAWTQTVQIGVAHTRTSTLNEARRAVAEAPVAIREPGILLVNREVVLAAIDDLRMKQS